MHTYTPHHNPLVRNPRDNEVKNRLLPTFGQGCRSRCRLSRRPLIKSFEKRKWCSSSELASSMIDLPPRRVAGRTFVAVRRCKNHSKRRPCLCGCVDLSGRAEMMPPMISFRVLATDKPPTISIYAERNKKYEVGRGSEEFPSFFFWGCQLRFLAFFIGRKRLPSATVDKPPYSLRVSRNTSLLLLFSPQRTRELDSACPGTKHQVRFTRPTKPQQKSKKKGAATGADRTGLSPQSALSYLIGC